MKHLVFLPGMMCDQRLFVDQITILPKSVTYSFEPCSEGESISEYAQQAILGARKKTDKPLIVVGLSMGGIVAMECMRQFSSHIKGAVLMDTNYLADPIDRRELRYAQIERALAGELKSVLINEMKPVYLAPENRDDEQLLSLVLDMALTLGPEVFARQSNALMNRQDYTDTLQQFDKPVAILCGAHDTACPPERHAAMHELLPHSSLEIIENAGHLTSLESAASVNKALLRFLEAV